MKIYPIHTLPTHERPHVDEWGCRWLLKKYGEKIFPGSATAKMMYITDGKNPFAGKTANEVMRDGFLPLGRCGGLLDEHPVAGSERKKDECAFTLTTKRLGAENDPKLKEIYRFVFNNDTNGVTQPFDIADIIQSYYREYPNGDPEVIYEWVTFALDLKYEEIPGADKKRKGFREIADRWLVQRFGTLTPDDPAAERILKYFSGESLQLFDITDVVKCYWGKDPNGNADVIFQWVKLALDIKFNQQAKFLAAKEEFERTAQIEEITGPGGRTLKMATIVSDNELMHKFARSQDIAVIIQKNSSGNVVILTNQKFGLTLYDTASIVNLLEQRSIGKVTTTDWGKLSAEGSVTRSWYFHHGLQALLNGSLTTPDVPPTKMSLVQIKAAVKIGVNPNAFEPKRKIHCAAGICTSTRKDQCPWYAYGLKRCRNVRFEQFHKKTK